MLSIFEEFFTLGSWWEIEIFHFESQLLTFSASFGVGRQSCDLGGLHATTSETSDLQRQAPCEICVLQC